MNNRELIHRGAVKTASTGVLLFLLFCATSLSAQAPQFSQFYAAPLNLAPSFAGSTNGSRLVLNYRNQWPQLGNAFVTYAFSFDHYFHKYRSGAGVVLLRDQAGSSKLSNTRGGLVYSYNFQLNHRWTIRPGVLFLYEQLSIDRNQLIFGDQLSLTGDESNSSHTTFEMDQRGYFDASSSLLVYSANTWAGLTFDNMMRPNQSMTSGGTSRVPLKFSVYGGYRYEFGGTFSQQGHESISVAALYKNQGTFHQFDLGVYWSKDPVSLGVLYRGIPFLKNPAGSIMNNDALVLMGGLRTRDLRIGYSYDFTVSRLINNTGGAHEISVIYQFNQSPAAKKHGKIPCPDGQL